MAEPPFVFTGVNWTGSTDLGGAAHYGTNTLWLELVQAPNPSILALHGTEPGTYYQILGKRHLETNSGRLKLRFSPPVATPQ